MLTETETIPPLPSNCYGDLHQGPRFETPLVFQAVPETSTPTGAFLTGYDFVEEPDGGFEWLLGLA